MQKNKQLWDLYRFPGFSLEHTLSGIFGDPRARVIGLIRRGKKLSAAPAVGSPRQRESCASPQRLEDSETFLISDGMSAVALKEENGSTSR